MSIKKKAEKATQIIFELNDIVQAKKDLMRRQEYEQASMLREKEKTLKDKYKKLVGSWPAQESGDGFYKEFVDQDKEQKYRDDLHKEAYKQEKEKMESSTGGVVIGLPLHLDPNNPVTALDWNKPERERIYKVKHSRNTYRKFDGEYRKHCSHCPFKEGCVMCTLP